MSEPKAASSSKRKAPSTRASSAALLNVLPVRVAKWLFERERSRKVNGCAFSTRKTKLGHYPRMQLPKHVVEMHLVQYLDRAVEWRHQKGKFKVGVHQLAFRSNGGVLPPYESNQDLCHTCGNGRVTAAGGGCIDPEHLDVGGHADNVRAQGCLVEARCPLCTNVFNVCDHHPPCRPRKRARHSKTVIAVTLHYKNGSSESFPM